MKFFLETARLGLANLRLHLLRATLTALGIILGVAAVITMSSLGEGSKREALARIERLGARNIIIRSQRPPETQNPQGGQRRGWVSKYGLTRADLDVLRDNFPDSIIVPSKEVANQVLRNERRKSAQAFGITPELAPLANLRIARGRYITQADIDTNANVAVIGAEMAKQFFPLDDPINETIRLDSRSFQIVGVLAPVGLAGGAGAALVGRDFNLDVQLPLSTAQQTFGDLISKRTAGSIQNSEVEISEIYIAAPSQERVLSDAKRVERILSLRHPGMTDVSIGVPYELLEEARKQALTYSLVFGAIAGISLLVGGIGIMNIMLASVTERTREIGIRRAIGATRKHILWQFLVETSVLSAIGGLMGVALGVGGSVLVSWLVPRLPKMPYIGDFFPSDASLPTQVTLWSIALSFTVAVAVGLIFGIYPARRAAAQDPIVALRHD
jgi:putative ABC transport system permease protein